MLISNLNEQENKNKVPAIIRGLYRILEMGFQPCRELKITLRYLRKTNLPAKRGS